MTIVLETLGCVCTEGGGGRYTLYDSQLLAHGILYSDLMYLVMLFWMEEEVLQQNIITN